MERFAVEHVCVSIGTVAAYCVDRRATVDNSLHTIRLWVNHSSTSLTSRATYNASAVTSVCDPKLAHVIIPMVDPVQCLQVYACPSQEMSELLLICILCATADDLYRYEVQYSTVERKVVQVDSNEQSIPNVNKMRLNSDGTRAVTVSLPSRGYDNSGNASITVWSEMLRRMCVVQPTANDIRASAPSTQPIGTILDFGFGGDAGHLVFACYSSGMVMGWDISTGSNVCTFSSTIATISAIPQQPTCFNCVGASVFVGFQDGKVKQYQVVHATAAGLGRSNPKAALRGIADCDSAEAQWQHRERAVVDLSRELRFRGMGGSGASVEGGIAVTRELVLSPLSMCYIPPEYSCISSAIMTSTAGGSGKDGTKKAGWDLPSTAVGGTAAKSVNVASGAGQLCVVTPSGFVVMDLKGCKVIHTVSTDALHVNSISSADCSLALSCSGQADGGAHVSFVFLAAFASVPTLFQLPLYPAEGGNSGYSATVEASSGDLSGAARGAPASGIGYDNVTHLKGVADINLNAANAPRRSTSTTKADRHSIYEDETVPLSYFVHPSMLPDRGDDSPRDGDSPGPKSRTLLASPKAKLDPYAVPVAPLRRASSAAANNWETPKKDKQGKLMDQPITFQRKIKSSGYGQIPQDSYERKKFFQQQEAQKKQAAATKALQRSLSAPRGGGGRSSTTGAADGTGSMMAPRGAHIRSYPLDCLPMQAHQPENDITTSFPVHSITFSEDGSLLGVATADSAVITVRLPASRYGREVVSYAGHNSRINNVSFTHSKYALSACGGSGAASFNVKPAAKTIRLLPQQTVPHYQMLSCSADGTARMWKHGNTDGSAIVFSHMKHSVGSVASAITADTISAKTASFTSSTKRTSLGPGGKTAVCGAVGNSSVSTYSASAVPVGAQSKESRNRPFGDDISYASYFYMDKFAVLASKASVLMYRYNMHSEDANDDLKRTLAQGTYQLVHQWDLSVHAQSVCAVSCINSTPSPLIFCATSDKFLNILDASTGTIARAVESPHTRNIHCIALPRPSLHVPLSPDAYNLFLTSAIDNNVNMWDLRAPSAVNRYNSHVNKREPVGCDISPCLRYIATGSEDKSCVVYDIRTGKVLHKLTRHKDVVRAVAFNPLFPQLATGSYDGTVKFYMDPTFDSVPL